MRTLFGSERRVSFAETAPDANELLHSPQTPRATTARGETEVFHLKLIAIDWAGVGGTVEAVNAACQKALPWGGETPPPE